MATKSTDKHALTWIQKYIRYTDYLGVSQLYLKDNFFMEEPLKIEHCKARVLGHWGTVPGLNFIYANLNYLVYKHKCKMLLVTGPGHGAPAILANLFADGTLKDFYKQYTVDGKGMGQIIKDFSWPHSLFPSHVTPTVPGSILEGGELGYSLATAYGAALDNPDLIVTAIVGDGEAESGPIAAAWHANKFLNPITSGAVLPIVHINGFKISNPTLFGTMDDTELTNLFKGYGYEPLIVEEPNIEAKMIEKMEQAYQIIKAIQTKARKSKKVTLKPKWPVILLRSKKGWLGIKEFEGHNIEGSFRSHGIPIEHLQDDTKALSAVEKWLKSYKIEELVDKKGQPKKEVMQFVPKGNLRIGMNAHAIGGNFYKKLSLPPLTKFGANIKKRGQLKASSMIQAGKFFADVFKSNKKNFRMFCPDEMESNKLGDVFKVTKRSYVWPISKNSEEMSVDGRVIEILSEHTLQGLLQGYLLTGRHGIFVTYEAFAPIISSMVDQYAKFLKQSFKVKWRKPISSAIYILSSLGWRQDHNGYSHQNPSFISGVLQKHGKFSQLYFPADSNMMMLALQETMTKKDSIAVIVAGKRPLPQWLTLKEAKIQAKVGIGIWEWVGGKIASKNPDVVMASCGDYITEEALFAVKMCHEMVPELKIRYVNVSELTALGLGDYCSNPGNCLTKIGFNGYFTDKCQVVFGYHGYTNDVKQVLWNHADSNRFIVHGYSEEGSTTTPFDLKVCNKVSCYNFAIDLIEQGSKMNKKVAKKKAKLIQEIQNKIDSHKSHIEKHGDDPEEVKNMKW